MILGEPFTLVVKYDPKKVEFVMTVSNMGIGKMSIPELYLDLVDMSFSGDAKVNFLGFTDIGIMPCLV